ncbi:MAG: aminotransferase class I/II-fold pyridoxal phosphate-dependent enzyme [Clostridia bacterium]|nr:aminotransferase class I/II-fold pyridoxal phosphate-dependent enzyme [Clostridia bacterium]
MNTPICDFVREYAQSNKLRLHMPGHKGESFLGIESFDITEIEGADVLYNAEGIIAQSEHNASELFGTAKTLYSAQGSSLSIRAMLYLAMLCTSHGSERVTVCAGRNAHKAFMCAAALLDIDIEWIFSPVGQDIVTCHITPKLLDGYLSAMSSKPAAVYITSPDYLGNIADIAGLSQVCHKYGVLLLVDNAHGAYLNFLPESRHPIALGADMCCDSAHKTLPVLTGGAYLHISNIAPRVCVTQAQSAMSLFASTSPSYLILQSLDMANRYISDGYRERLAAFAEKLTKLKQRLADAGYTLLGDEVLKLTVFSKDYGYTGLELSQLLYEKDIVCEFSDPDYAVMMLTPELGEEGLLRLERALLSVKRRAPINDRMPQLLKPKRTMSAREALFSQSRELDIHECIGRVLASASVSCPPAIPVAVCGEEIDESAVRVFEYYGIESCIVVEQ